MVDENRTLTLVTQPFTMLPLRLLPLVIVFSHLISLSPTPAQQSDQQPENRTLWSTASR